MLRRFWRNVFRSQDRKRSKFGRRPQQPASSHVGGRISSGALCQEAEALENRMLPAVITVTSLADTIANDGQVTLREAIKAANTDTTVDGVTGSGADTIQFDPAMTASGPATITLAQGQLEIHRDVAVVGPTTHGIAISGNDTSRIFFIVDCTTTLSHLTLQNGKTNEDGGAIFAAGNVTLVGCTLFGNSGLDGGAIWNSRSMAVVECTLSGNTGGRGGAYSSNWSGASLIVDQCTVVGNVARGHGGALYNGCDSVWRQDRHGHDVLVGMNSNLKIRNSIVAGNSAGEVSPERPWLESVDIGGWPISSNSANNLIGISSEELATVLDLHLADNGGPTKTHALLKGSPAIDAGNNALIPNDKLDLDGDGKTFEALPFDQRGKGFARVVGGQVDIGAVEYSAPRLSISAVETTKPEGHQGATPFVFTVLRSGDTGESASVSFAVTGRSSHLADAADFGGLLPSGTVEFAPGDSMKTITINVSGDTAIERNDGFFVTLSDPSEGTTLGKATALGRISNDDALISVKATDASKLEGNDGWTAFVFTVTRTGATASTASVTYVVSGRGARPADAMDFGGALPSGQVDFAAGETENTITILVSGDTSFERNEGVLLTLSNPSAGSTLALSTALGTILDDDQVAA